MVDVKPRIFISYARSDGEAFATELRRRLAEEVGEEQLWQDRAEMEGGVGWWKQITDALDNVEFMVLVATPNAMQSPVVRKEWRYARQQGVCVYPVQVPELPIDFDAMPRWMRDSHFYTLDKEWETFVNYLKSKCEAVRVPFMPPDLPTHFVERPDEFDALMTQLLDDKRENPVAISTSLTGAGGFGKTTLATALCHDDKVQTAFDDGILWVTLGEQPDIVGALTKLYEALTGEQPSFIDIEQGKTQLSAKLADNDCLIVIDDVWDSGHLRPFLQGGERCARLITTRFVNIAVGADAQVNDVDQMSTAQAVEMLTAGLNPKPTDLTPFEGLAKRLGKWALMLEITNGMIREQLSYGDALAGALAWINETLDDEGIFEIEQDDEDERKRSAEGVLAGSFRLLKDDERIYLTQLGVFREDSDVPISSVSALWTMKPSRTRRLLTRLASFSFIKFDLEGGTIHLHDVVREVLETHLIKQQPLDAIHAQLITGYKDLHRLPDSYAWTNIAYHLKLAKQTDTLRGLLADFDWLYRKLSEVQINLLLSDYDDLTDDDTLRLIHSALSNASHCLHDPAQLPAQMIGRLGLYREAHNGIERFLTQTKKFDNDYALLLNTFSLQPAGGALIRTIPVRDRVNDLALSDDGQFMLTASSDKTVRVWNWQTGEHLRTLEGHTSIVNSVTVSDAYALSASWDNTVRVWNWQTGEHLRTLEGHTGWVNSVTVSDAYALSASSDNTVRVWNWQTGEHLRTLEGHTDYVMSVTVSDAYALSASLDNTVRVWNWQTGACLAVFTAEGRLESVAIDEGTGAIVAGGASGRVHFLRANGRLRRLMGLD